MSSRVEWTQEPALVGYAAATAAAAAVADALWGVVSVLSITVAIAWFLNQVGGVLRAVVLEKPLSWRKWFEGVAKAFFVVAVAILAALVEAAQQETFQGGQFVPLVAPVLSGALMLFVWSMIDQVADIWPEFGDVARRAFISWKERVKNADRD